jgi:arsenate reductase (thioredoxin)
MKKRTMRILILCTGNSCRSQMAEGFLKSFDPEMDVFSAGTQIASEVNPMAIQVMKEEGIDLSKNSPKMVDGFLQHSFDFVVTVCEDADQNCPVFIGKVKQRLHLGFQDPAKAKGSEEEILNEFRNIRDQIKQTFYKLYKEKISYEIR